MRGRWLGWMWIALVAGCNEPTPQPAPMIPATVTARPPPPAPVMVTVDARGIHVDGRQVVPLSADRSLGADAAYKRSGPSDLYLVPLADAFAAARAAGRLAAEMVAAVSADTPYRVLVELLFTAAQSELSSYQLHEDSVGGRSITTRPPRGPGYAPPPPDAFNLTLHMRAAGTAIRTAEGNVAPGCSAMGAGLAVPRAGSLDAAAIVHCVKKLRADHPAAAGEKRFTLAANPDMPFRDLVEVVLAMRGTTAEPLYPDVVFAILR